MSNSPSRWHLATLPDSPRFRDAEMGLAGLQTSPDQPCFGPGTPAITGRSHAAPACGHAPPGATSVRPSGELAELGARHKWGSDVSPGKHIAAAHHSCHVWRPPCLTAPPGSPDPPGSGLPMVLHAVLGSTHWALAWTQCWGPWAGACRTPDHPPVEVLGDQRPQGDRGQWASSARGSGHRRTDTSGHRRTDAGVSEPQLCRWLTVWVV